MMKIEKISKLFLFVEKYRSKYIFGLILAFVIIILLVLSNSHFTNAGNEYLVKNSIGKILKIIDADNK